MTVPYHRTNVVMYVADRNFINIYSVLVEIELIHISIDRTSI